jgi:hypothetical protein
MVIDFSFDTLEQAAGDSISYLNQYTTTQPIPREIL